jgi:hypothetical protein
MARRQRAPSSTWRSFLQNHAEGIAAIDMFVVASASFRLLYVMIILAHNRRKIMRAAVTEHPTAGWLSRQLTEAFPWETAPRYLLRDRDASFWLGLSPPGRSDGHHGGHHGATLTLVERLCRARNRFDSPRMFGSHRDLQRAPSAARPVLVYRLLPPNPDASFARQRLSGPAPDHPAQNRKGDRHSSGRRLASSLRTPRSLIRLGFLLTNYCAAARYAVA